MSARLDYMKLAPDLFRQFAAVSQAAKKGGTIEAAIHDLVAMRASQINGCAFCVDMHAKEAKLHGERELRLYHLPIWRESPLFSARERAALAWTEALTTLDPHGVDDALYDRVHTQFSERELVELTYAVMTINGWNRLNAAFRNPPGSADQAFGLDKAGLA